MSDESVSPERTERLARLRERAEADYPESWIASDQSPEIAGEFLRLEQGQTVHGPQWIAILRTEDGRERSVWLLHAALKGQFARLRPKQGELVCVRWKGKRTSGAGNDYDDYSVVVDRNQSDPDWASLAVEAGENGRDELEAASRSLEHLPAGAGQGAAREEDQGDLPF